MRPKCHNYFNIEIIYLKRDIRHRKYSDTRYNWYRSTIVSTMSARTRINDGDSNTARWTWISSTSGRWPVSCLFIVALLRLNCYLVLTLWDIPTYTYTYASTHIDDVRFFFIDRLIHDLNDNYLYFTLFKSFRNTYIYICISKYVYLYMYLSYLHILLFI